MIMLQSAPWLRSPLLVLGASIAIGLVLAQLARIFGGPFLLWWLVCTVIAGGVLVLGLRLAYPTLAYDPTARTAKFGRHTVPLDTITRATRSVSAANGAAYLTYRFHSKDGPSVRVLVAGRPMRGLDEPGRAALAAFIEELPLEAPHSAAVDAVAAGIVADGKKVPVGREVLLAELRGADHAAASGASPGAATTASAPAGSSPTPDAELDVAAAEDDLAALATVESVAPGVRVVRRIAGLLFFLSLTGVIVAGIVVLVAGAVGVGTDAPVTPVLAVILVSAVTITGLTWSIAGDLHTHAVRTASLHWMQSAEADARARGLPAPFHEAWVHFAPGHRILTIAAFVAGVIGLLLTLIGLIGLIAMATEYPELGFAMIPGLVLSGFAIWFWVAHRRRRRADIAWVVQAAGPRAGLN